MLVNASIVQASTCILCTFLTQQIKVTAITLPVLQTRVIKITVQPTIKINITEKSTKVIRITIQKPAIMEITKQQNVVVLSNGM